MNVRYFAPAQGCRCLAQAAKALAKPTRKQGRQYGAEQQYCQHDQQGVANGGTHAAGKVVFGSSHHQVPAQSLFLAKRPHGDHQGAAAISRAAVKRLTLNRRFFGFAQFRQHLLISLSQDRVATLVGLVAYQCLALFTEQCVSRGGGDQKTVLIDDKSDAVGADFLNLQQLRQSFKVQVDRKDACQLAIRSVCRLHQRDDQLLDGAGRVNIRKNSTAGLHCCFVPGPGACVVSAIFSGQDLATVTRFAG